MIFSPKSKEGSDFSLFFLYMRPKVRHHHQRLEQHKDPINPISGCNASSYQSWGLWRTFTTNFLQAKRAISDDRIMSYVGLEFDYIWTKPTLLRTIWRSLQFIMLEDGDGQSFIFYFIAVFLSLLFDCRQPTTT